MGELEGNIKIIEGEAGWGGNFVVRIYQFVDIIEKSRCKCHKKELEKNEIFIGLVTCSATLGSKKMMTRKPSSQILFFPTKDFVPIFNRKQLIVKRSFSLCP